MMWWINIMKKFLHIHIGRKSQSLNRFLEDKHSFSGYKGTTKVNGHFRWLHFTFCSIIFLLVENPYCTPVGIILDLAAVVPLLKKYSWNPVTGEKFIVQLLSKFELKILILSLFDHWVMSLVMMQSIVWISKQIHSMIC